MTLDTGDKSTIKYTINKTFVFSCEVINFSRVCSAHENIRSRKEITVIGQGTPNIIYKPHTDRPSAAVAVGAGRGGVVVSVPPPSLIAPSDAAPGDHPHFSHDAGARERGQIHCRRRRQGTRSGPTVWSTFTLNTNSSMQCGCNSWYRRRTLPKTVQDTKTPACAGGATVTSYIYDVRNVSHNI